MLSANQLETLLQLVNKEIDYFFQKETFVNRDILITHIKHLQSIKEEIETQQKGSQQVFTQTSSL